MLFRSNRWGNLVFSSFGGKAFEGLNISGNELPEGVYFYIVTINNYEFKGSLTLKR